MQWSLATVASCHSYFQSIRHKLVSRTLGLKHAAIESWAIEGWFLLTLLAIEGMLLSVLVVRLVKRKVSAY
jgi:hypothetical protein